MTGIASVLKSTISSPVQDPSPTPSGPPTAPPNGFSGLADFNLEDLTQQARQQLEQVRQEIARQRAEAAEELQRLRDDAYQQGLQAGRAAAQAEADQRLRQAVEARVGQHGTAVQAMVQQIGEIHQQWMQQYADSLVSTAIAIADRVVRDRLQREPEIVLRWAAEALAASRSANRLTVALHPETLAALGPSLDELLCHPGLPEDTTVLADESVPRDGVVVRQLGGEVAATLDSQLDRLSELLRHA